MMDLNSPAFHPVSGHSKNMLEKLAKLRICYVYKTDKGRYYIHGHKDYTDDEPVLDLSEAAYKRLIAELTAKLTQKTSDETLQGIIEQKWEKKRRAMLKRYWRLVKRSPKGMSYTSPEYHAELKKLFAELKRSKKYFNFTVFYDECVYYGQTGKLRKGYDY